MASWTNQSTSSLLPGEPWTSAKALAAFENPEAIAEGASGAPVQTAAWHAYNRTNVGDSGTGKFYDHAVDGNQTTVETPNFENNYEYRILGRGLGKSVRLDYLISGSWYTVFATSNSSISDFDFWIKSPRRSSIMFAVDYSASRIAGGWTSAGVSESGTKILSGPSAATVTRARLFSGVSFASGQMYLLRRRED